MTARYLIGDVFDRLAELEDSSVDLVITSPPFLALRSYLPADHPDKAKEMGSEATPAEFLDGQLRVMAELRRVTAAHGSVCIELGDTYAGSGGAGGDYDPEGLREGQPKFRQARFQPASVRNGPDGGGSFGMADRNGSGGGGGWPLAKSRALIPELFRIALAYGINPLTGAESPAGKWLVRNVVTWCRPNPPVGALGDKWRPATSDVVVACTSPKRYWDDLATRRPFAESTHQRSLSVAPGHIGVRTADGRAGVDRRNDEAVMEIEHRMTHSGAPLLDYWEIPLLEGEEPRQYGPKEKPSPTSRRTRRYLDGSDAKDQNRHDESVTVLVGDDGHPAGPPLLDYWVIPPGGYPGAHYAVFPPELVTPLVKAMCPEKVCRTCGEPSRRIVSEPEYVAARQAFTEDTMPGSGFRDAGLIRGMSGTKAPAWKAQDTLGWSDCGHDNWRPGIVLDPFAGSGTTGLVATGHGADVILIDLDERNAVLARDRVGGLFLEVEEN